MANTQAPFGFRPSRRQDGAEPNYKLSPYPILSTYNTAIAKGDPVSLTSAGVINAMTPGTGLILGIFWGCKYYDTVFQRTLWSNQWNTISALAGSVEAYVIDDTRMVFDVQAGGAAVAITQADVGANINFAGQSTPNAAGFSQAYADQTTINPATTTLPFRIVGLSGAINNDPASAYDTIQVIMNNANFNSLTGV